MKLFQTNLIPTVSRSIPQCIHAFGVASRFPCSKFVERWFNQMSQMTQLSSRILLSAFVSVVFRTARQYNLGTINNLCTDSLMQFHIHDGTFWSYLRNNCLDLLEQKTDPTFTDYFGRRICVFPQRQELTRRKLCTEPFTHNGVKNCLVQKKNPFVNHLFASHGNISNLIQLRVLKEPDAWLSGWIPGFLSEIVHKQQDRSYFVLHSASKAQRDK